MKQDLFKKLPFGGVDSRSLISLMAERGPKAAATLLAKQRQQVRRATTSIADDTAVVLLGGSNGITRALAIQLLFGQRAAVYAVHYDSLKMRIGAHHVRALKQAADEEGLRASFFNRDATRPKTIEEVVATIVADGFRAVHLVNGIAAGATKRYAKHGPTTVADLDVAFDQVLQIADFGKPENYRKLGRVQVDVATEAEIERTNRLMGRSSKIWVDRLAEAGLIAKGESVVAFCDYDFEPDDPVYALGPLAGAKILQRQSMQEVAARFGPRTVRLCYPAMNTTALGAIPGALLMYAMSTQLLLERGEYQGLMQLAEGTMAMWRAPEPDGELRLDRDFKRCLPELRERAARIRPDDLPSAFGLLLAQ